MFKRLLTALTGAAHEAGDAVMDTDVMQNAEVRGATEKMRSDLEKAIQNEAVLGGNVRTSKRELAELTALYDQNVNAAIKADERGDAQKAEEFALEAASLETQVNAKKQIVDQFETALETQKRNIAKIKQNMKMVEMETKGLAAQKAVNQAKKAATASMTAVSGEDSQNALAVLRKQKEKAAAESDRLDYVDQQQVDAGKALNAADYLKENNDGLTALQRLKAKSEQKA